MMSAMNPVCFACKPKHADRQTHKHSSSKTSRPNRYVIKTASIPESAKSGPLTCSLINIAFPSQDIFGNLASINPELVYGICPYLPGRAGWAAHYLISTYSGVFSSYLIKCLASGTHLT